MDELAALRYCAEVLAERQKADPARAWLWTIKRKTALHFIRGLERPGIRRHARFWRIRNAVWASLGARREERGPVEPPADAAVLTEQELELIRQTHPLLQDTRSTSRGACLHSHCQWYIEIKEKVGAFAESWQGHRGQPSEQ